MNECREYRRMIIHFFSRDLTSEEEKILKDHLERCEECKKEFVLQEKMESILLKRPLSSAPVAVIERVLSIIPERKEVYARPYFNWKVAVSIASVVAAWVIVAITHYFTHQPGVLSTFIEGIPTMMTNFSLNFTKPSYIIGTVVYSLIVSSSTLFIFWRSLLSEVVAA